jgi:hypothetical protein
MYASSLSSKQTRDTAKREKEEKKEYEIGLKPVKCII